MLRSKEKTPKGGLCSPMSCSLQAPVHSTEGIIHKYLLDGWKSVLTVPTVKNRSRALCRWTGPTQGPAALGQWPVRASRWWQECPEAWC